MIDVYIIFTSSGTLTGTLTTGRWGTTGTSTNFVAASDRVYGFCPLPRPLRVRYHHMFELSRADRYQPSTIRLAPRELRPLRQSRDSDGWRLHVQVVSHTGRGP